MMLQRLINDARKTIVYSYNFIPRFYEWIPGEHDTMYMFFPENNTMYGSFVKMTMQKSGKPPIAITLPLSIETHGNIGHINDRYATTSIDIESDGLKTF